MSGLILENNQQSDVTKLRLIIWFWLGLVASNALKNR